jgi:hypothetical protein
MAELQVIEESRIRMRGLYWKMTSRVKDYGAKRDLQIEIMRTLGIDYWSPMNKWKEIGRELNKRERELIGQLHDLDIRGYKIDNAR